MLKETYNKKKKTSILSFVKKKNSMLILKIKIKWCSCLQKNKEKPHLKEINKIIRQTLIIHGIEWN